MKRTPSIMVLIEANTTSNRNFLLGISKFACLYGPWIFHHMVPSYLKRNKANRISSIIKENNISGIITCDTIGMDQLIPSHIPMVVVRTITEPEKKFPNVIPNDRKIANLAAKHLLSCGFNFYGYCGFKNLFWSEKRQNYFEEAIKNSNREIYIYNQSKKRPSLNKEFKSICDWLVSVPKPIGIFCCNDDRSKNVMEACKICNLSVPEKVAVIGVDDDLLVCEMSRTPLTSIALNSEAAGYESAQALNKLLQRNSNNKHNNIIVEPTHVVARQSTDIFSIPDSETAEAIRFIRENANKPINVDSVTDAVSVSRRVLEIRFKKYLGRSIYKEIKRYRSDLIGKLLIETEMSVSEIAIYLGFPDVNHISRYFQSEKGVTLRDYRKRLSGVLS